jgi:hypothetical protein
VGSPLMIMCFLVVVKGGILVTVKLEGLPKLCCRVLEYEGGGLVYTVYVDERHNF